MPVEKVVPLEIRLRRIFKDRITVEQEPWPGPINVMDRRGRLGWLLGKKIGYIYDMRKELGPYRVFHTVYKDVADLVARELPDEEVVLTDTGDGPKFAGI